MVEHKTVLDQEGSDAKIPIHNYSGLMLLVNVFVLGGCLVLFVLAGPTIPLILTTVGTIGLVGKKLRQGKSIAPEKTGP